MLLTNWVRSRGFPLFRTAQHSTVQSAKAGALAGPYLHHDILSLPLCRFQALRIGTQEHTKAGKGGRGVGRDVERRYGRHSAPQIGI